MLTICKGVVIVALGAGILGGSGCDKRDPVALKVGKVTVTVSEFERGFKSSPFINQRNGGREAFLESLISQKLILNEALQMKIDRDPRFVEDVESYRTQALFNRVLARKQREMASEVSVVDEEIKEYYRQHSQGELKGRTLSQVYDSIKWKLARDKQNHFFSKWRDSLKRKTRITVNREALGIQN